MSIFSEIGNFIVNEIAKKIFKFISEVFTEKGKRKYTEKLRKAKVKYESNLGELDRIKLQALPQKRKLLEITRRKALRIYLDAQIAYYGNLKKILSEAKQEAYDNIKNIKSNINKNKEKYYKKELYNEFHNLNECIHNGIKKIKSIELELTKNIEILYNFKKGIPWESNEVGSKKKIKDFLESNNKILIKNYKGNNSLEQIEYNNYLFYLNNKCSNCKIKLNEDMKFCYNCGEDQKIESKFKFFKKYTNEELHKCKRCNAPLSEEFKYCYNCGINYDPYGFYALTK